MKPWKLISRAIHVHAPFLKIEDVVYETPDGRQVSYSLHQGVPSVCVLALTSDLRVVLARQFRPGPGLVLDELPGGVVDSGENLEDAVKRELLEETGFVPHKLIALGRFFDCAYTVAPREGFLALGCEKREEQKLDQTEFIEVILKPLPEFFAQIRKGLCTDAEVAWSGLLEAGLVTAAKPLLK